MMAVTKRLDRGLHDVRRSGEIRLPDPEVDDVASLCREIGGSRQNGKRIFIAQA